MTDRQDSQPPTVRCWICKAEMSEDETKCQAGVGTSCRDVDACRKRRLETPPRPFSWQDKEARSPSPKAEESAWDRAKNLLGLDYLHEGKDVLEVLADMQTELAGIRASLGCLDADDETIPSSIECLRQLVTKAIDEQRLGQAPACGPIDMREIVWVDEREIVWADDQRTRIEVPRGTREPLYLVRIGDTYREALASYEAAERELVEQRDQLRARVAALEGRSADAKACTECDALRAQLEESENERAWIYNITAVENVPPDRREAVDGVLAAERARLDKLRADLARLHDERNRMRDERDAHNALLLDVEHRIHQGLTELAIRRCAASPSGAKP